MAIESDFERQPQDGWQVHEQDDLNQWATDLDYLGMKYALPHALTSELYHLVASQDDIPYAEEILAEYISDLTLYKN